MLTKKKSKYILMIIFVFFGIVIAIQFKSTIYAKNQTALNSLGAEKLVDQIASEQKEVEELKKSIDENLKLKEKYIKAYMERNNDDDSILERKRDKFLAGLVDVKGPGIIIKLDDAAVRKEDTPLNWLIIHDQDIKIILNDLKEAGAQAISINNERVVPMSEQICAGPTILINGNRYSVPYVITAIGEPEVLYESISRSERIAEMVEYDIRVEITKSNELTIPKFSGGISLDRFISGLEVDSK
ncbi:MAG: DUF881 domain-containing protein [Clostridiales bacterium]|nr:DUF881 domain-containing protein [Clostridiales bacterium]